MDASQMDRDMGNEAMSRGYSRKAEALFRHAEWILDGFVGREPSLAQWQTAIDKQKKELISKKP